MDISSASSEELLLYCSVMPPFQERFREICVLDDAWSDAS